MRLPVVCPLLSGMALLQRNSSLHRSSDVTSITHRFSIFGNGAFVARGGTSPAPSRLLSSSSTRETIDKKASADDNSMRYRDIAGSRKSLKSFGGLTFKETHDDVKRVIFVLGGPGSGKGTQSDLILKNYPCVHLSAGELLREETKKADSEHAALIEECLVAGKIVPVEISLVLLRQAMEASTGQSMVFLIDGFPRNFDNLDGWANLMTGVATVDGVLAYDCPLDVLEKRILERAKGSGRSDDNLDSLRRRFRTFEAETVPVMETLRKSSQTSSMEFHDILADRSVDEVWCDTKAALDNVIANDVLNQTSMLLEAVATSDAETYANLCADEMVSCSPKDLLQAQEGSLEVSANCVTNAELRFVSGTKVQVSYERKWGNDMVKESRMWSHQHSGWKMVHFSRSPK